MLDYGICTCSYGLYGVCTFVCVHTCSYGGVCDAYVFVWGSTGVHVYVCAYMEAKDIIFDYFPSYFFYIFVTCLRCVCVHVRMCMCLW